MFIPGISCIFVAVSMVIAFSIAANSDRPVHFYCGRKAAFGENFGTFIYLCNIVCNLASSILNGAAYLRARQLCKIQYVILSSIKIYLKFFYTFFFWSTDENIFSASLLSSLICRFCLQYQKYWCTIITLCKFARTRPVTQMIKVKIRVLGKSCISTSK